MPYYIERGEIPPKRHTQFRNPAGDLYFEELLSRRGFSGEHTNMYHLHMPTDMAAVGRFMEREIQEATGIPHRHRHLRTAQVNSSGGPIGSRQVLFFNDDVIISKAHPDETLNSFYRNGHADELLYVQSGKGTIATNMGNIDFVPGDYVVIPRGIIWQMSFDEPTRFLVVETRGPIDVPDRYVSARGQLLEHAPLCERDLKLPDFQAPIDEKGEYRVMVRLRGGIQEYIYTWHPFDLVGWAGQCYPWAFSIHDFEPITGRIHQPPPVHQTFQAPGVVICSFVPRLFDYHPQSIPAPYYHSNVDSDEILFYSRG
ncbi:MAG: homogentisate 1,2-dioxygenase, partial [Candidatus Marinimicrobia bacterium]|nr:homogentisate 1,2-dioxygenase [Candidatus Neomarinimicrobiota bacterium]